MSQNSQKFSSDDHKTTVSKNIVLHFVDFPHIYPSKARDQAKQHGYF